jgi:hypothetical protein
MRLRVVCECGKTVTSNTWKLHIGTQCTADQAWKDNTLNILKLKTKHERAWLKFKNQDAVASTDWYLSVIQGKTNVNDWGFVTPRKLGSNTPQQRVKASKERLGAGNPAVKSKKCNHDIEIVKIFAQQAFKSIQASSDTGIGNILKLISIEFPGIWYQLAGFEYKYSVRGTNKRNAILAYLLEISTEDLIKIQQKQRGKMISAGQLASPAFIAMASEHGSKLLSRWRVTKPQLRLFNIIRQFDSDARLEEKIKDQQGKFRSYDIYSPLIGSLIEMHGRVWHDLTKTKPKLTKIVLKNTQNDIKKQRIAEEMGLKYLVFWDDKEHEWKDSVEKLYAKT